MGFVFSKKSWHARLYYFTYGLHPTEQMPLEYIFFVLLSILFLPSTFMGHMFAPMLDTYSVCHAAPYYGGDRHGTNFAVGIFATIMGILILLTGLMLVSLVYIVLLDIFKSTMIVAVIMAIPIIEFR